MVSFYTGYSGPTYTWCKRQHTANPIYQRLDRCLVNLDWYASYPNTEVLNLPIILSDHAPILVFTNGNFASLSRLSNLKIGGCSRRIFRFMLKQSGTTPRLPLFLQSFFSCRVLEEMVQTEKTHPTRVAGASRENQSDSVAAFTPTIS